MKAKQSSELGPVDTLDKAIEAEPTADGRGLRRSPEKHGRSGELRWSQKL